MSVDQKYPVSFSFSRGFLFLDIVVIFVAAAIFFLVFGTDFLESEPLGRQRWLLELLQVFPLWVRQLFFIVIAYACGMAGMSNLYSWFRGRKPLSIDEQGVTQQVFGTEVRICWEQVAGLKKDKNALMVLLKEPVRPLTALGVWNFNKLTITKIAIQGGLDPVVAELTAACPDLTIVGE